MSDTTALARRLTSLAVAFMGATRPLSLDLIHQAFYSEYPRRSFYVTFRRDRASLATCGLRLREAGDDCWKADPSCLAGDVDADPVDLQALDLACLQLVADPSFPYREELRHALLKLDHTFSDSPLPTVSAAEGQSAKVVVLLRARASRHPVRVRYVDAADTATDRTLCVLGEFGLRGHVYFVACDLTEEGISTPRVFRDDRFRRVRELDGPTYDIPEGFRASDWRRLPFQVGDDDIDAELLMPAHPDEATASALQTKGEVSELPDGRRVWRVHAADVDALAAWTIAGGLTPLGPERLVEAYRTTLEEAIHG